MKNPIKVLIVDDSKTCTLSLYTILNAEPDIEVIACASNGLEGLRLTKELKPDLVTMDIFMPIMDGVATTTAIMEQCPTPIVVISSCMNSSESTFVFDALQAGALSVIEKPKGILDSNFDEIKGQILNSVRALAGLHVFKRNYSSQQPQISISNSLDNKILVLGSSTGGPEALHCILSSLPENFPMPIAITQHISPGFLAGLVNWLQNTTKLKLQIAKNYETLLPGNVYFADDNIHLIIKKGVEPIAILDKSAHIDHLRPSINALFSSVALNYPGTAIGGLLTGMGKDGATGLLKMKESGCVTFVQSEKTSIIYGMPCAANALNAAQYSIDLEKISQFLATVMSKGEQ